MTKFKAGAWVRCTKDYNGIFGGDRQFTKGNLYVVAEDQEGDRVMVVQDDEGDANGLPAYYFEALTPVKDTSKSPQNQTIARLLLNGHSLTHLEALAYGIWSLSSRVSELKKAGWPIDSKLKTDAFGKRYASYSLTPAWELVSA